MTYTREQMRDVAAYFESYFSSAMYGWASGADVASMFRQLLDEVDRLEEELRQYDMSPLPSNIEEIVRKEEERNDA